MSFLLCSLMTTMCLPSDNICVSNAPEEAGNTKKSVKHVEQLKSDLLWMFLIFYLDIIGCTVISWLS